MTAWGGASALGALRLAEAARAEEGSGLTEWEALQRRDFARSNPPPEPTRRNYEAEMADWTRRLDLALARRTAQRVEETRLRRLERVFPTGETRAAPAEPGSEMRLLAERLVRALEVERETSADLRRRLGEADRLITHWRANHDVQRDRKQAVSALYQEALRHYREALLREGLLRWELGLLGRGTIRPTDGQREPGC